MSLVEALGGKVGSLGDDASVGQAFCSERCVGGAQEPPAASLSLGLLCNRDQFDCADPRVAIYVADDEAVALWSGDDEPIVLRQTALQPGDVECVDSVPWKVWIGVETRCQESCAGDRLEDGEVFLRGNMGSSVIAPLAIELAIQLGSYVEEPEAMVLGRADHIGVSSLDQGGYAVQTSPVCSFNRRDYRLRPVRRHDSTNRHSEVFGIPLK
jgi:hypothetical protein